MRHLIHRFPRFKHPPKFINRTFNIYNFSTSNDTIYALSSGVGTAISVVRISGIHAHRVLELLSTHNKLQPRKAYFRNIYNTHQSLIDRCIIIYFPHTSSYNNQDIYELHLHGSKAIVSAVFKQLKQRGMRMAQRGQFTKRALLNGKINLIEAESINDLIRSESEFSRQIAVNNLLGKGVDYLQNIKKEMVRCLANNEAYIDFQQDEGDVKADLFQNNKVIVRKVLGSIESTLENYKNLQIIKQGVNVSIMGRPNVGKSTLINGLAKKDVSIVSEEAGTTRDIVQTQIECGGVMVNLYDTAGLRKSYQTKIQAQGIKRAKQKIKQSQIKLFIIDLSQQQLLTQQSQQIQIINYHQGLGSSQHQQQEQQPILIDQNTIVIINKSDQLTPQQKNNKYYITLHQNTKKYVDMIISSTPQNQGIQYLWNLLQTIISTKYHIYENTSQIYFTRQRYFDKLTNSAYYLQQYLTESRPDIACELLRNAISEVSQIFGKTDCQDVLDVLFKQFCIGK